MADETKAVKSPPAKKKKGKGLKIIILIFILLIAGVAVAYFLEIPGFQKVTGVSSKVLRMKMPDRQKSPSKTTRKPVQKASTKPVTKGPNTKTAAPSKTKKPVKVAASTQTNKTTKVSAPADAEKTEKAMVAAKIAAQPVKSSSAKGEADYEFEMKRVDNLLKTDAENTNAIYNRGWLNERNGNMIEAEKDYSEAIDIDDKLEDAYFNRGLIYVEMKKFERAVSDFTQYIKMKPRSADAYCNRGNAYFKLGKRNFALRDYDAALRIDPNDADIYFNRALLQLEKGNKPSALSDFKRAADLGLPQASKYLTSSAVEPQPATNITSTPTSKTPVKTASVTTSKPPITTTIKFPPKGSAPKQTMASNQKQISAGSAMGRIHGNDFNVEEAGIANGILTLRQGKDFFPDNAVLVFLFLKEGEQADGRTFHITKNQGFGSPHIHMKYKQNDQNTPKTEIFMKDYTMRLEFGKRENGVLPGKIFLSLPDKDQSFVNGTFLAQLK